MHHEDIVRQIDVVLDRYKQSRKRSKYDDCSDLPEAEISEILTLFDAAIQRLSPPGSSYIRNAEIAIQNTAANNPYNIPIFHGILIALRHDYLAGYLISIQELIHADVFSDFLGMADHLLEEGYKDPAAVIAGGVLEEHLRKLCDKSGISVMMGDRPKKADALNAELAGSGTYGKLDQKSVTAWLDLRNKAAHGRYAEYTKEQVSLMVQSVRDFLTRHSA